MPIPFTTENRDVLLQGKPLSLRLFTHFRKIERECCKKEDKGVLMLHALYVQKDATRAEVTLAIIELRLFENINFSESISQ